METQLLFLIATMPPSRESDFLRALRLASISPPSSTLRTATTRANVRYEVRSLPTREVIVPEMQRLIAGVSLFDKILVFCTTVDMVESLARELGSLLYHAKLADKNEMLRQFDRPECRTMVATTALSLGLNKQDIGLVVHVGHPFNLLNYAQESERGGRDGRECHAIIVRTSSEDSLSMDWSLRQYLWGIASQHLAICLEMLSRIFTDLGSSSFILQAFGILRKLGLPGYDLQRNLSHSDEGTNMIGCLLLSTGSPMSLITTDTKNSGESENNTQTLPAGSLKQLRRLSGSGKAKEGVKFYGFTVFPEQVLTIVLPCFLYMLIR